MKSALQRIQSENEKLVEAKTWKEAIVLEQPMQPRTKVQGHGDVLVLSSNNYLGLANHPEVVQAGEKALEKYGAGTASVRFICGTFDIHQQLEQEIAQFLKFESALSFVSCWTANTGLLPLLVSEGDVLISDELNHASIIDACRLSSKKVTRQVYGHSDMSALENLLKEAASAPSRVVVSDGVFSMEGDIAKLPDLVDLCEKYDALLVIDDSHGTGVMGKNGRGVAEHFGLEGQVDVLTSTLGKALGGAAGGFVAGPKAIVDHCFQKARPQLFSNALAPTVAASSLKAIQVLKEQPNIVEQLHNNVAYFREALKGLGYQPLEGESAIIPIIVGETARAIALSKRLLEEGIFVTGFGFPVVPEGTARIRLQMSAALTREDLDLALDIFKKLKPEFLG